MSWREPVSQFLHVLFGSTARPYSTFDFGRAQNPDCISVIATDARQKLPMLREHLNPGLFAFIGTSHWLGDEKYEGVEVVVGQGESQFDIVRMAQTDAVNYNMDTEDLIAQLQKYDEQYGIDIYEATTDTISFMLLSTPEDVKRFAEDIDQFCPDAVDQGAGSLDNLAEMIARSGEVHLWWD